MNRLDIALVIIIALSVISGFFKGITRMGIGFAAMVIGLVCGFWFYGWAGSLLRPYISSRETCNILGFFLIFCGVLIFGSLVARLLEKLLKLTHLSWLDRLLGAGFGFARGVLVSTVILVAFLSFGPKSAPSPVVHSRLAPYVMETAHVITRAAPRELKDGFRRSYDEVKKVWGDAMKKGLRKPPSDDI